MYLVHLDTGQFWEANGTITRTWTNPSSQPMLIHRTSLWGGMSIGANMDFAAALYITGNGHYMAYVGPSPIADSYWMVLNYMALDRYGESNGQNYQQETDWTTLKDGAGNFKPLWLEPGQQLILQGNCDQHGGEAGSSWLNKVFVTPASNDNGHAQARIWMS